MSSNKIECVDPPLLRGGASHPFILHVHLLTEDVLRSFQLGSSNRSDDLSFYPALETTAGLTRQRLSGLSLRKRFQAMSLIAECVNKRCSGAL